MKKRFTEEQMIALCPHNLLDQGHKILHFPNTPIQQTLVKLTQTDFCNINRRSDKTPDG